MGYVMGIKKITKATASAASHIYTLSWKVAYKNIVPDDYLDNLSLERWTLFLEKSEFSGYLLKVNDEFVATSSIAPFRFCASQLLLSILKHLFRLKICIKKQHSSDFESIKCCFAFINFFILNT